MTLTQNDFNIIMKKLDKFEEDLKKLEKEIEELKPKYRPATMEDVQKKWDEITQPSWVAGKIPCMFDSLTPEQRNQPLGLVCRCPKCSPYSLSGGVALLDAVGNTSGKVSLETTPYALSTGSLLDSGTIQQWRVATENEDYEE